MDLHFYSLLTDPVRSGVVLLLLLLGDGIVQARPGDAPEPGPAQPEARLAGLSVPELIDRLAEVSEEGVGFHSTAWAEAFIAEDDTAEFRGGVLGSARPVVSPVLRELVRRGAAALPDLIDHLKDARDTRLKVGGGIIMAMWHSDEYDPRYGNPGRCPPGVNVQGDDIPSHAVMTDRYTVRVGDLCYVAVGQIVNRRLYLLRYQPSSCLVINSPVATPALAEAVRQDWGGLTPADHKESLVRDAFPVFGDHSSGAVRRLSFYYPGGLVELRLRQVLIVLVPAGACVVAAGLWRLRRRAKARMAPQARRPAS